MYAEWGFMEIPEMMSACEQAASIGKTKFSWADWDDLFQDALIYLAERPNIQFDYFEGRWHSPAGLGRYLYRYALQQKYLACGRERDREISWDLFEDGGSDDGW